MKGKQPSREIIWMEEHGITREMLAKCEFIKPGRGCIQRMHANGIIAKKGKRLAGAVNAWKEGPYHKVIMDAWI
jgi:hypothetical protein